VTDGRRHVGEVPGSSVLGEEPFCAGGTTSRASSARTITQVFHCQDSTLKIRFSPTRPSLVQGAQWEVVSGTGEFDGLRGGGSMVARFTEPSPDTGQVTFAGTVGTQR
jgi:hypothetical protein